MLIVAGYKKYLSMPRSCYKLHTTVKSWNDAFKVCEAEYAHLIILNSAIEAKLSRDLFMEYIRSQPQACDNKYGFMVGFNKSISTNEYRTIDGEDKNLCWYLIRKYINTYTALQMA